jgi:predicted SAM-dependent methyltransferase
VLRERGTRGKSKRVQTNDGRKLDAIVVDQSTAHYERALGIGNSLWKEGCATLKERLEKIVKRHRFSLVIALAILFSYRKSQEVVCWPIRPLMVKRYLKSHEVRKLQLGAGPNMLPGWLNTDKSSSLPKVLFLDAAARFPFRDASVDYIYSEHLIEHLTYDQGQLMLRECFRVLRPGGRIRTATPDLETLAGLYTPQKSSLQQRYIQWIVDRVHPEIGVYQECVVINSAFRDHGHQFLYDYAMLQRALEKAGFVEIARCSVGESDDEVFRGIERHAAAGDEEMNLFETMVVEARRSL